MTKRKGPSHDQDVFSLHFLPAAFAILLFASLYFDCVESEAVAGAKTRKVKAILFGTCHPNIFYRCAYLKENKDVELLGYYDTDQQIASACKNMPVVHCTKTASSS